MTKQARMIATFAVSILSACNSTRDPNQELANQAEKAVADTFKDPTSDKFKDVTASAKANCIMGKVLAKNSLGAFTGYHDFVWMGGQSFINNAQEMTALSSADDINNLASYVELQTKCMNALPHGNGPDTESVVQDT